MVPFDVPEASLDLLTRFLDNKPFNDYLPPQTPSQVAKSSTINRFFRRRHFSPPKKQSKQQNSIE
jgi:hypothetical protein